MIHRLQLNVPWKLADGKDMAYAVIRSDSAGVPYLHAAILNDGDLSLSEKIPLINLPESGVTKGIALDEAQKKALVAVLRNGAATLAILPDDEAEELRHATTRVVQAWVKITKIVKFNDGDESVVSDDLIAQSRELSGRLDHFFSDQG